MYTEGNNWPACLVSARAGVLPTAQAAGGQPAAGRCIPARSLDTFLGISLNGFRPNRTPDAGQMPAGHALGKSLAL